MFTGLHDSARLGIALALLLLLPSLTLAQNQPGPSGAAVAHVICDSGCGSPPATPDTATFLAGTTNVSITAAVFDDTLTGLVAGKSGAPRMTAYRGVHFNLRTNSGVEVPFPAALDAGGGFKVACITGCAAGTPGQTTMANSSPVVIASDQSAVAISNAGITSIDGKIPALGQALAAGSVPVILPSATVTTLTPPAAITGFALAATQTDRSQKTQITDGTRDGTVKAASTLPLLTDTAVVTTQRDPLPAGTNLLGKADIQLAGTAVSGNVGVVDAGTTRTNFGYTTAGPTAFNSTAAGISISVTGKYQVGFFWSNAAFTGTINFQSSSDGGSTWDTETCIRHDTIAQVTSIAYVANTSTLSVTCIVSGPATDIRINNTAVSAGTSTQRAMANYVISPFALGLSLGVVGLPVGAFKTTVAGVDESGNVQNFRPRTTAMTATTDPGLVVRPYMPTNGTQTQPTMDAAARTGYVAINDGTDTALVTTDGVLQAAPAVSNIVALSINESAAAPTAAVWYLKREWALPASAHAVPMRAFATVTTAAGSRTMIGVMNSLGTINLSTNAFAATNSVASPLFYGRLFGCVTTVMSATLDTLTVTYTDELGVSSTSAAVAFAASAPVGNCYEFALGGSDVGARAVTNITDTAAPTGIVTVYGVTGLFESLGTVTTDATTVDSGELKSTEEIGIMFIQAATTAQQRTAGLTLSLR